MMLQVVSVGDRSGMQAVRVAPGLFYHGAFLETGMYKYTKTIVKHKNKLQLLQYCPLLSLTVMEMKLKK